MLENTGNKFLTPNLYICLQAARKPFRHWLLIQIKVLHRLLNETDIT